MRSLGKNPILRHSQRLEKLFGALRYTHKCPKCIQTLWNHPKKSPFVETYKESAICAILRGKPHFGHSQRLKKVLQVLRCAKNAPQWPPKIQIPRDYQKKKFIV